jgi:hypothetical protein
MQTSQKNVPIKINVLPDLELNVFEDEKHEILLSTKEVAAGYGISESTIRNHKLNNKQELLPNVHFLDGSFFDGIQNRKTIFWTKAGVIRLGFFIKSERAIGFRNAIENLVLRHSVEIVMPKVSLVKVEKRKHNRLTATRLLDIMTDIALIDDKALRISLMQKILPENMGGGAQLTLPLNEKGGSL